MLFLSASVKANIKNILVFSREKSITHILGFCCCLSFFNFKFIHPINLLFVPGSLWETPVSIYENAQAKYVSQIHGKKFYTVKLTQKRSDFWKWNRQWYWRFMLVKVYLNAYQVLESLLSKLMDSHLQGKICLGNKKLK